MILLAVDTATQTGSVALLRDGRLAGVISTMSDEAYSSRFFRQLEFLLHEMRLQVQEVDVFAVAAGPGSFTGLRVGLTAVKAWGEVFSKPIIAVSGLEAIAAQARILDENALIAPMLDARRGQVFAALYKRDGSQLIVQGDEQVCTAEEFIASLAARAPGRFIYFVSPTPEILQSEFAKPHVGGSASGVLPTIQEASPLLAPIIGQLAFGRATRGEFTDALRLDANYIRRSDAELLWKKA